VNHTQRVTEVDIRHGRIRVPIAEKHLFPDSKTRVHIRLHGVDFPDVAWDPRQGPDRERSGTLYIGQQLQKLASMDQRLEISLRDGVVELLRTES
jgi:hypothetical protein